MPVGRKTCVSTQGQEILKSNLVLVWATNIPSVYVERNKGEKDRAFLLRVKQVEKDYEEKRKKLAAEQGEIPEEPPECESKHWNGPLLDKGTLIVFNSGGSTYTGVIIGTCSYDLAGPDNAYVVRYVWPEDGDVPRKPYTIADASQVYLVTKFPEDFTIGGGYSATPDDRLKNEEEWMVEKQPIGLKLVVRKTYP